MLQSPVPASKTAGFIGVQYMRGYNAGLVQNLEAGKTSVFVCR